jgi:hypothetical protein
MFNHGTGEAGMCEVIIILAGFALEPIAAIIPPSEPPSRSSQSTAAPGSSLSAYAPPRRVRASRP